MARKKIRKNITSAVRVSLIYVQIGGSAFYEQAIVFT